MSSFTLLLMQEWGREDNGLAANRQDGVWQSHFMGQADITIFLLMSPDLFRCARLGLLVEVAK